MHGGQQGPHGDAIPGFEGAAECLQRLLTVLNEPAKPGDKPGLDRRKCQSLSTASLPPIAPITYSQRGQAASYLSRVDNPVDSAAVVSSIESPVHHEKTSKEHSPAHHRRPTIMNQPKQGLTRGALDISPARTPSTGPGRSKLELLNAQYAQSKRPQPGECGQSPASRQHVHDDITNSLLQPCEHDLVELKESQERAQLHACDDSHANSHVAHADEVALNSILRRSRGDELTIAKSMACLLEEQINTLRLEHADEVAELSSVIQSQHAELVELQAHHQQDLLVAHRKEQQALAKVRAVELQNMQLKKELQAAARSMTRMEDLQEEEFDDYVQLLKRLGDSSSEPVLQNLFVWTSMELIGMGNYGYVFTCRSKKSGARVVVKLQSERWASVVAKEWAHGAAVGQHDHLVEYIDAVMHRDANHEIKHLLEEGFRDGVLRGKRPENFPKCYFCLAIEYMDRGTVQHLMNFRLLTLDGVGAITRQIGSALAFMHKKSRTHNDVKPENILLREDPKSGSLVAKLADLGLAEYSVERQRDCDLLGYTVFCMGLAEGFSKVPAGVERAEAVTRFKSAGPSKCGGNHTLWSALAGAIEGLWMSGMDMYQVQYMEELQHLIVNVPECREASGLEECAKLEVKKSVQNTTANIVRRASQQIDGLKFLGDVGDQQAS